MKEEKYYLFLNNDKIKIIVRSLIMLRNTLLNEGLHTTRVDNLITKTTIIIWLQKQLHRNYTFFNNMIIFQIVPTIVPNYFVGIIC